MPLFRHATPVTNLADLAINRHQRSQLDRFFRLLVLFTGTEGREPRSLAILGLVMGGALVAFFAVLEDVLTRDPLVRIDDAVFHLLQSLRTASLDRAMVVTTELGDWVVTTAVTLAALIWLLWRHKQRTALYFCATVVASAAFSFLLKFTLRVARPVEPTSGWDIFSFPSGHATVNATLYGFLAVLIAREVQSWKRGCVVTVALAIILSIALSRLYLGAHFLSDVLAGLCLSVAWITLVSAVYLRREPTDVGAGGLSVAVVITIILVGGLHIRHRYPQDAARYASHIATRLGPSRSPGNWPNSWLLRETVGHAGRNLEANENQPLVGTQAERGALALYRVGVFQQHRVALDASRGRIGHVQKTRVRLPVVGHGQFSLWRPDGSRPEFRVERSQRPLQREPGCRSQLMSRLALVYFQWYRADESPQIHI
jgi:membrane-associated phospholipid phosphatase